MLLPSTIAIALVVAPQVVQVEAVLEAQIGSSTGPREEVFGRVVDLAADDERNVYVLDDRAGEVRVFSPAGEYMRTLGRSGSGPGELNRPSHIDVRGGVVTVLNPGGRSSSFTLTGELVASETLPFGSLSAARVDDRTHAVFVSGGITRGDPVPIESLVLVGPASTDTILTVPSNDILFRGPTASSLLRTSLCRLANFVVGEDGTLWVASGTDGMLTEWRLADGVSEPARSAELAPPGVPLPDSTRRSSAPCAGWSARPTTPCG